MLRADATSARCDLQHGGDRGEQPCAALAFGDDELADALVARGRRPERRARRRSSRQTAADDWRSTIRPSSPAGEDRSQAQTPSRDCAGRCVACVSTRTGTAPSARTGPARPIGMSALHRARSPTSIKRGARLARPAPRGPTTRRGGAPALVSKCHKRSCAGDSPRDPQPGQDRTRFVTL